jgi:hypothetical protein
MLEPNIYGLWVGKQTAKGTENTTPGKRLIWVGGDFGFNRDDGEEKFSDLSKYGDRTDYVNSLTGQGTPAVEASATELAYLLWLFHGAETVEAVEGPPDVQKHTTVPSTSRGHWATFVRRLGLTGIQRHSYIDSMISQVQIEGSTANKVVRITPTVMSLDPAKVVAADPSAAMPTTIPFLYTDGAGAFKCDTFVFKGQGQFTFVANEDLSFVYGDNTIPHDLVQGSPTVTIAVTLLMDSDAQAEWNRLVYGNAAPAAGTKPVRTLPPLGSYEFSLTQTDDAGDPTGLQFDLGVPGVKWAIPDAPGPNPEGGATEIALAGAMRPVAGEDPYTIDVYTEDSVVAFTT